VHFLITPFQQTLGRKEEMGDCTPWMVCMSTRGYYASTMKKGCFAIGIETHYIYML
jgi:hypothetical protein